MQLLDFNVAARLQVSEIKDNQAKGEPLANLIHLPGGKTTHKETPGERKRVREGEKKSSSEFSLVYPPQQSMLVFDAVQRVSNMNVVEVILRKHPFIFDIIQLPVNIRAHHGRLYGAQVDTVKRRVRTHVGNYRQDC